MWNRSLFFEKTRPKCLTFYEQQRKKPLAGCSTKKNYIISTLYYFTDGGSRRTPETRVRGGRENRLRRDGSSSRVDRACFLLFVALFLSSRDDDDDEFQTFSPITPRLNDLRLCMLTISPLFLSLSFSLSL